jgi:hypothetical protein
VAPERPSASMAVVGDSIPTGAARGGGMLGSGN